MAYDEELAGRVRAGLSGEAGLTERRMFGGLAFLINGNLAVSASSQGGLLLRVEPAQTQRLAEQAGADRFMMRGREMDGWLRIDPSAIESDDDLTRWVSIGIEFARRLPPK